MMIMISNSLFVINLQSQYERLTKEQHSTLECQDSMWLKRLTLYPSSAEFFLTWKDLFEFRQAANEEDNSCTRSLCTKYFWCTWWNLPVLLCVVMILAGLPDHPWSRNQFRLSLQRLLATWTIRAKYIWNAASTLVFTWVPTLKHFQKLCSSTPVLGEELLAVVKMNSTKHQVQNACALEEWISRTGSKRKIC